VGVSLGVGVGVTVGVSVGVSVGVTVGVSVGTGRAGQLGPEMVLPSVVKAPVSDTIRPSTLAPETTVTSRNAMSVPTNALPDAMVASRLICQNTLQARAPPAKITEPLNVKSVLIWKTQTSVGLPVSVSVPANAGLLAAVHTPGARFTAPPHTH